MITSITCLSFVENKNNRKPEGKAMDKINGTIAFEHVVNMELTPFGSRFLTQWLVKTFCLIIYKTETMRIYLIPFLPLVTNVRQKAVYNKIEFKNESPNIRGRHGNESF